MRMRLALAGLIVLGGCAETTVQGTVAAIETLDLVAETRRDFAAAYQDQPFDTGTVYVVANEHGDLHTYSLTPCRGGTRICGGAGGVGHLQRTLDYDIVTGAYSGRTFYLSPGGDGILKWQGVSRDLAWN